MSGISREVLGVDLSCLPDEETPKVKAFDGRQLRAMMQDYDILCGAIPVQKDGHCWWYCILASLHLEAWRVRPTKTWLNSDPKDEAQRQTENAAVKKLQGDVHTWLKDTEQKLRAAGNGEEADKIRDEIDKVLPSPITFAATAQVTGLTFAVTDYQGFTNLEFAPGGAAAAVQDDVKPILLNEFACGGHWTVMCVLTTKLQKPVPSHHEVGQPVPSLHEVGRESSIPPLCFQTVPNSPVKSDEVVRRGAPLSHVHTTYPIGAGEALAYLATREGAKGLALLREAPPDCVTVGCHKSPIFVTVPHSVDALLKGILHPDIATLSAKHFMAIVPRDACLHGRVMPFGAEAALRVEGSALVDMAGLSAGFKALLEKRKHKIFVRFVVDSPDAAGTNGKHPVITQDGKDTLTVDGKELVRTARGMLGILQITQATCTLGFEPHVRGLDVVVVFNEPVGHAACVNSFDDDEDIRPVDLCFLSPAERKHGVLSPVAANPSVEICGKKVLVLGYNSTVVHWTDCGIPYYSTGLPGQHTCFLSVPKTPGVLREKLQKPVPSHHEVGQPVPSLHEVGRESSIPPLSVYHVLHCFAATSPSCVQPDALPNMGKRAVGVLYKRDGQLCWHPAMPYQCVRDEDTNAWTRTMVGSSEDFDVFKSALGAHFVAEKPESTARYCTVKFTAGGDRESRKGFLEISKLQKDCRAFTKILNKIELLLNFDGFLKKLSLKREADWKGVTLDVTMTEDEKEIHVTMSRHVSCVTTGQECLIDGKRAVLCGMSDDGSELVFLFPEEGEHEEPPTDLPPLLVRSAHWRGTLVANDHGVYTSAIDDTTLTQEEKGEGGASQSRWVFAAGGVQVSSAWARDKRQPVDVLDREWTGDLHVVEFRVGRRRTGEVRHISISSLPGDLMLSAQATPTPRDVLEAQLCLNEIRAIGKPLFYRIPKLRVHGVLDPRMSHVVYPQSMDGAISIEGRPSFIRFDPRFEHSFLEDVSGWPQSGEPVVASEPFALWPGGAMDAQVVLAPAFGPFYVVVRAAFLKRSLRKVSRGVALYFDTPTRTVLFGGVMSDFAPLFDGPIGAKIDCRIGDAAVALSPCSFDGTVLAVTPTDGQGACRLVTSADEGLADGGPANDGPAGAGPANGGPAGGGPAGNPVQPMPNDKVSYTHFHSTDNMTHVVAQVAFDSLGVEDGKIVLRLAEDSRSGKLQAPRKYGDRNDFLHEWAYFDIFSGKKNVMKIATDRKPLRPPLPFFVSPGAADGTLIVEPAHGLDVEGFVRELKKLPISKDDECCRLFLVGRRPSCCKGVLEDAVYFPSPHGELFVSAAGIHLIPNRPDGGLNTAVVHGKVARASGKPKAVVICFDQGNVVPGDHLVALPGNVEIVVKNEIQGSSMCTVLRGDPASLVVDSRMEFRKVTTTPFVPPGQQEFVKRVLVQSFDPPHRSIRSQFSPQQDQTEISPASWKNVPVDVFVHVADRGVVIMFGPHAGKNYYPTPQAVKTFQDNALKYGLSDTGTQWLFLQSGATGVATAFYHSILQMATEARYAELFRHCVFWKTGSQKKTWDGMDFLNAAVTDKTDKRRWNIFNTYSMGEPVPSHHEVGQPVPSHHEAGRDCTFDEVLRFLEANRSGAGSLVVHELVEEYDIVLLWTQEQRLFFRRWKFGVARTVPLLKQCELTLVDGVLQEESPDTQLEKGAVVLGVMRNGVCPEYTPIAERHLDLTLLPGDELVLGHKLEAPNQLPEGICDAVFLRQPYLAALRKATGDTCGFLEFYRVEGNALALVATQSLAGLTAEDYKATMKAQPQSADPPAALAGVLTVGPYLIIVQEVHHNRVVPFAVYFPDAIPQCARVTSCLTLEVFFSQKKPEVDHHSRLVEGDYKGALLVSCAETAGGFASVVQPMSTTTHDFTFPNKKNFFCCVTTSDMSKVGVEQADLLRGDTIVEINGEPFRPQDPTAADRLKNVSSMSVVRPKPDFGELQFKVTGVRTSARELQTCAFAVETKVHSAYPNAAVGDQFTSCIMMKGEGISKGIASSCQNVPLPVPKGSNPVPADKNWNAANCIARQTFETRSDPQAVPLPSHLMSARLTDGGIVSGPHGKHLRDTCYCGSQQVPGNRDSSDVPVRGCCGIAAKELTRTGEAAEKHYSDGRPWHSCDWKHHVFTGDDDTSAPRPGTKRDADSGTDGRNKRSKLDDAKHAGSGASRKRLVEGQHPKRDGRRDKEMQAHSGIPQEAFMNRFPFDITQAKPTDEDPLEVAWPLPQVQTTEVVVLRTTDAPKSPLRIVASAAAIFAHVCPPATLRANNKGVLRAAFLNEAVPITSTDELDLEVGLPGLRQRNVVFLRSAGPDGVSYGDGISLPELPALKVVCGATAKELAKQIYKCRMKNPPTFMWDRFVGPRLKEALRGTAPDEVLVGVEHVNGDRTWFCVSETSRQRFWDCFQNSATVERVFLLAHQE